MPKGLELKGFTRLKKQDGRSGVSSRKYADVWFNLPDGLAFYKTYEDLAVKRYSKDNYYFGEETRNVRMLNELVCYELANQVGVDCAKYEPATNTEEHFRDHGLVSYNVCADNEKLISLAELIQEFKLSYDKDNMTTSIKTALRALYCLRDQGQVAFDENEVIESLFKQVAFDVLTMQSDRKIEDVRFVLNIKNNTVRVAPLLDNEFAFCGMLLEKYRKKFIGPNYIFRKYKKNKIDISLFSVDGMCDYLGNVSSLVSMCEKSDKFDRLLDSMIKNIDIDKAVKSLKTQGVDVSEDYRAYVKKSIENAKMLIIEQKKEMQKSGSERQR